jgi:hypothetical protein
MERGILKAIGPINSVTDQYLQTVAAIQQIPLHDRQDREGDGGVKILSVQIEDVTGSPVIRSNSRLKLTIEYRSNGPFRSPAFLVGVYDISNTGLFLLDTASGDFLPETLPEHGKVVCLTDRISLIPGRCYINIAVGRGAATVDYIRHAAYFDVEPDDIQIVRPVTRNWVFFVVKHEWIHATDSV